MIAEYGQARQGLMILDPGALEVIYGPAEQEDLQEMVRFRAPPQTKQSILRQPELLADAEVIFTGWGAPLMDEAFLAAAPKLRAVFHGAGSIRSFTTPALWRRGIAVTCAADANAEPVAEYTLGVILLGLRSFWRFAGAVRQGGGWGDHTRRVAGGYRSTVGLISCGVIARKVLARLAAFDVNCIVYDPFMPADEIATLGAAPCSLRGTIRARGRGVAAHAGVAGNAGADHRGNVCFDEEGATFINTARGAVVREMEMIEVLRRRPDLQAVLDVCDPEPAPADSPLLQLPNVVLTPHIAGSLGPECQRLGRCMVDEMRRFVAGEPLRWQVSEAQAMRRA